jgi:hypothetical protein
VTLGPVARKIAVPPVRGTFPEGRAAAVDMPRQQPYQFVYHALPGKLFAGRRPLLLLADYPRRLVDLLGRTWRAVGDHLPPPEHAPGGPQVSAHHLGGRHPAVLLRLPPAERPLEPCFVALVFTPALRYFVLGRAPDLPGLPHGDQGRTTLREVTANGMNANLGPGPAPTSQGFLAALCAVLEVPPTVADVPPEAVRGLAGVEPAAGAETPEPGPVTCRCGRRFRPPPGAPWKTLRCHHCGALLGGAAREVPDDAARPWRPRPDTPSGPDGRVAVEPVEDVPAAPTGPASGPPPSLVAPPSEEEGDTLRGRLAAALSCGLLGALLGLLIPLYFIFVVAGLGGRLHAAVLVALCLTCGVGGFLAGAVVLPRWSAEGRRRGPLR